MVIAISPREKTLLGSMSSKKPGVMALATVAARILLSVFVTLKGLVSEIRPVFFLGSKKRRPKLNPSGGG